MISLHGVLFTLLPWFQASVCDVLTLANGTPAWKDHEKNPSLLPIRGNVIRKGLASIQIDHESFPPEIDLATLSLIRKVSCFPALHELVKGEVIGKDGLDYGLSDLKIGDEVQLVLQKIDKHWYVMGIAILRRENLAAIPAGRFPDPVRPKHVLRNVINDWNFKGIAIPNTVLERYGYTEHPAPPQWMKEGKPAPFK